MERKMCLYKIKEEPYLSVSEVYCGTDNTYYIEDTHEGLKEVDPLYVGSFDAKKLYTFGALVSKYFQKGSKVTIDTVIRSSCALFSVDPCLVI